jgi:tetratricopeptide (TPR) repeat protein
MEHGDVGTAIVSLNRIVAFDKYNGPALDTLAILYLQSGANDAALKIATRAANLNETDAITEVLAKSNKNLGNHEAALEYFGKLLTKNPESLNYLYEVAYANINVGRLAESVPYIQQIIAHQESATTVMKEFIKEGSQTLPYRAVAYNMLGYVQAQAGQDDAAIKSYEAALAIFPNYYLATNNLGVLKAKGNKK